MTQQELDALKALADAATRFQVERGYHHVYRIDADGELQSHATFVGGTDDAAWYVAARAAMPALLAEVERLRDELAEAERLRDAYKVELGGMCKAMADSSLLPTGFIAAELRKERIEALYGAFGADETKWPDSAKARLAGLQEDQARYEARYT